MKFKQLHTTLLLPLCAALTACSDQVLDALNPDKGKTPIELTVGGTDANFSTRAVISDGKDKTKVRLPKGTSIYMMMMADDLSDQPQDTKCTRTVGFAQDIQNDDTKSSVSFTASGEGGKFTRYWEDAYSRKSALSIVAVCNPEYGHPTAGATKENKKSWRIGGRDANFTNNSWVSKDNSDYPTLHWPIGDAYSNDKPVTDQLALNDNYDFVTYQDLCFSNNIGNNADPYGDTRMKFENQHFTSGNLVFYHALSKLSFNIKMGQGFNDTEFKFKENTNIKLSNFYNGGTFDISNGVFLNGETLVTGNTVPELSKTPIERIFNRTLTTEEQTEGIKFGLDALVIPGTDLSATSASTTNALSFILAGNEYKLSMAQLYAAFTDEQKNKYFESGKLKAGVHYVFTFTIGKTKIEKITAQLVPWETVNATYSPTNARIEIDVEDDRGKNGATPIQLYRAHDDAQSITDEWVHYEWEKGYTDNVTLTYDSESQKYSMQSGTEWYWESNMTYYHFRTVQPSTHTVTAGSTDNNASEDDKCDYITLTSSATGITEANDVKWGAPFKDLAEDSSNKPTQKFKYNFGKGFDVDMGDDNEHQIYKAIGPTLKPITIIPFHMMSDVTIKLKTVDGNKAVTLDGATVKLVNAYAEGKVLMGNGKVIGTGDKTDENGTNSSITYNSTDGNYKYGAVPQNLAAVELVIQTSDQNRYIVPMASIFTTTAPSTTNIENPYQANNGKYYIDKWYPGFKYEYELELSKTGINNFRATIVDWEKINVNYGDITIK